MLYIVIFICMPFCVGGCIGFFTDQLCVKKTGSPFLSVLLAKLSTNKRLRWLTLNVEGGYDDWYYEIVLRRIAQRRVNKVDVSLEPIVHGWSYTKEHVKIMEAGEDMPLQWLHDFQYSKVKCISRASRILCKHLLP